MADLVAELVTEGVVEGDHAVAARAAVHLDAVRVDATAVMRRELRDGVRMVLLAGAGGAMEPVVGVVDAVRDQLLADVLAHRAFVPAALAGIDFLEHHARRQHHFLEVHRRILADHQPAGRQGLEIFTVRLAVAREMEGAARRRQETQVDRVQQQLRRRADVDRRKLARRLALDETQGETRTDPLSRQVDAPGIARVTQSVVVELTFAEPAARGGLEEHGHAARDLHLAVAVMDRRAIARSGADADQLAVDGLRGGQIDILHPATVGRGDLDERVFAQHGAQLGAILVRQLRDGRGIVDQSEGIALGLEIQDAGRSRFDEVSRLRQQSRRRHLGRAENLARAVQHRDRDRCGVGS